MPSSSRMELMSKEKPLHSVDSSELKTLASVLDITDGSMKLLNANPTTVNHHQSHGRSVHNSSNHANASTSRGKVASLHVERLSFKLTTQCTPHTGYHPENKGKEIFRPNRLRSSSLMVFGFCQKPLRRRPYFFRSRLSYGELFMVAVLVCGHIYHAECLEQRTCLEDRRDPTCPLCLQLLSQDYDLGGHE
ncbi:hypothetical protein I3842_04G175300 [Carya illinoinensis]|uniref:RING-type domain-containing protein n=1 Tax=Carya illinoinensis TaxID=32201 RepID=A0A922FDP3_CARIL|nr:hypothetical protein I3842_04G175300 [Carya illinoinensis]